MLLQASEESNMAPPLTIMARNAAVHGCAAAQIEYILSSSIPQENSPAIELNIAIIQWFQVVQNKLVMPWSLWCVNH